MNPSGSAIGRLIEAVIDVLADQLISPDRGIEIALRGPHDPALAIRMDEQSQQLQAIRRPPPADCSVAVGRDDDHVHATVCTELVV